MTSIEEAIGLGPLERFARSGSQAQAAVDKAVAAAPGPKAFRFEATVLGQLASKANSRKNVLIGGVSRSIKSLPARQFTIDCLRQLGRNRKPYEGNVKLTVWIYYRNLQSDLEPALLMDCIQEGTPKNPGAAIIKNDRQVWDLVARRCLDKDRPRVHFVVEAVDIAPERLQPKGRS